MRLLLGEYEFKARALPLFVAMLPIVFWFIAFGFEANFIKNWFSWLLLMILAISVSHFFRDKGKRLQKQLFCEWGGNPAVIMLRHSDNSISRDIKLRYHRFLKKNVPGLQLASAAQEKKDISKADKSYESAIEWLISSTRDSKKCPPIPPV